MLLLAFFSGIFLWNHVSPQDLGNLSLLELVDLGLDTLQVPVYEVGPNDVTFYLLTEPGSAPFLISPDDALLDRTKTTAFIIHGWLENANRSWYKVAGDNYLKNYDANFIEVDWERAARMNYLSSAKSTRIIGNVIAQFIEDAGLCPGYIHLIGHSLGSHVAGFAGKKILADTGEKLQRISALDPAGPYFSDRQPSDRLDKGDAVIVDAIHTDAGFFGYANPIGTLDTYVNGGRRSQPGCIDDLILPSSLGGVLESTFCSHTRSTKYFGEWIGARTFTCRFCQAVVHFNLLEDKCVLRPVDQALAAKDVTVDVTGICFARTNREPPYLN